jgi:hypothetical protein
MLRVASAETKQSYERTRERPLFGGPFARSAAPIDTLSTRTRVTNKNRFYLHEDFASMFTREFYTG